MPDSNQHSELRDFIERADPTSIGMWLTEFDMLVKAIDYEAKLRVASEQRLQDLRDALEVIAERRVPTTFGGGLGAVVNFARATLAKVSPGP